MSAYSVPAAGFEMVSNPYFLLPGGALGFVKDLPLSSNAEMLFTGGLWVQYLPLSGCTEVYIETSAELRRPDGRIGVALTAAPLLFRASSESAGGSFSCALFCLSVRHHARAATFSGGKLEIIPETGIGFVASAQGFSRVPEIIARVRLRYSGQ